MNDTITRYPIYIIEGPDGSGKTTIGQAMAECMGAHYMHLTYRFRCDMFNYHTAAIEKAIRLSATQPVIIDRWWPSELIYAQAFRGGSKWPMMGRMLDRVALKHGATYVMCVPTDEDRYFSRFDELKATGREMFDTMSSVYGQYVDLLKSMENRHDVVHYSIDADGQHMDEFIEGLIVDGEANVNAIDESWRDNKVRCVSGNMNANTLIVGNSRNTYRREMWPYHGKSTANNDWTTAFSVTPLSESGMAWSTSDWPMIEYAMETVKPENVIVLNDNVDLPGDVGFDYSAINVQTPNELVERLT